MENVFWMLWLADLSNSLFAACLGLGIPALVIILLVTLIGGVMATSPTHPGEAAAGANMLKAKRYLPFPIALIIVATLLPSKNTIYVYLGVSVTRDAVSAISDAPLAQKTMKLLEQKIDEALSSDGSVKP